MFALFKSNKPRRWSLRSRLTVMMILAFFVFQILMMIITMSMGLLPLISQSVEDLSERLIDSARFWSSLSSTEKPEYQAYIQENAGFYFFNDSNMAIDTSHVSDLVFNQLLSKALSKKQRRTIVMRSSKIANNNYYWTEIKVQQELVRIGFRHERIGTNPYAVIIALFILNIIFSVLTAFIFVGYITRPLMNLINAAKSLGRGIKPEIEHKNNSLEIQDLYDQFEKMSTEVQSLLDNRNTLLIGISHELRTPITRLTLLLELARNKLGDADLEDCNQVLQEMNAIIGQFLSLGRGVTVQESTQINLNDALLNMVNSLSSDRIQFELNYPYLIDIPVDSLRRVVLNLIDNALKYSSDTPVELKVEKDKSTITIIVLDRGIGIPAEQTTEILQAFVRGKKERQLNIKGVGLGLAISHLIAQTNGWTLAFSARPGGGTVVKLNIATTTVDHKK